MKQETVWRCRNVAVLTWRLQTCSLETKAVLPPLFITIFSLFVVPFPPLVCFPLFSPACPSQYLYTLYLLYFLSTELQSALALLPFTAASSFPLLS